MIYITDDIRIRRQDKLNVIIERKSDPNKVPKHLKDKVKSDEEKWLAEIQRTEVQTSGSRLPTREAARIPCPGKASDS